MTLGKRIAAARKKAKLTQKQVGDALGLTAQAVSDWERDQTRPEIENLRQLVHILKTTAHWLLEGNNAPPDVDDPRVLIDRLTPQARRQAIRYLKMLAEDDTEAA